MSYSLAGLFACVIFFVYPTSISREFYLIETNINLSDYVLNFIRQIDTNINCNPSMHVALSLIAALAITSESKKQGILALVWFCLISYSTMATKQHYFYDVLSGALLGLLFWFLNFYYIKNYRKPTN